MGERSIPLYTLICKNLLRKFSKFFYCIFALIVFLDNILGGKVAKKGLPPTSQLVVDRLIIKIDIKKKIRELKH